VGIIKAVLQPTDGGPPVEISKDLVLVGRTAQCDLRINYRNVSKVHCVIVRTDGLLLLRDLGSTNGTRVNGQRVRRAALLPNDELSIANHCFKILLGPAPPEPGPGQEPTQRLDTDEIEQMLHNARTLPPENGPKHRINPLPDSYPGSEAKKT
jgi:pSer/pThr/pTyr-binding forkhead associated (FHA) protein